MVEVTVERIVYGGVGLARHEGRVLLIPYAAPGDRALVEIVEERADFARARIVRLMEASADRRDPPCPYYGTCGGCQLQHLQYAAQQRAKAAFVRESLERIGGVVWTEALPVIASEEFHYRLRAQLKVRVSERGVEIGYYRPASHEMCPIAECPLLSPALNVALSNLSSEAPERFRGVRALDLAQGEDGRVAIHPSDERTVVSWSVGAFAYTFDARTFFQANRFLLADLVHAVTEGEEGERALDLFCGVGFFTLPLGRRFAEVIGVEHDARAVWFARRNARENGVTNCRFERERAETWLARNGGRLGSVDLAVLDPPRAGLSRSLIRALVRVAPERITYVSCHPAALARDLKLLLASGYAISSIVVFDLFPQTFHVETIVKLRRGAP
ncbi:MAG: class I SAM-dependent RNA methyltransferase [Blastocatellia bacterium]|nr:class I SAM-dependent RNA methyltransferase [Blastocatellia bacterium]MCS7158367.1 class I SAM-dependent RNA methyltransferase [Blastocatellia bacterium]MCX7752873.1 class I SAM-dependent RNA methyltransferase [Blastocatellia bacterium]MDW8167929.1 class I SAM-dependent RNA methyltransferase [Acidobacteriota bacterium]MDW8255954.1 class I SAM-dependent RNA methyltransferase [Acidobacteriota bacterium]